MVGGYSGQKGGSMNEYSMTPVVTSAASAKAAVRAGSRKSVLREPVSVEATVQTPWENCRRAVPTNALL